MWSSHIISKHGNWPLEVEQTLLRPLSLSHPTLAQVAGWLAHLLLLLLLAIYTVTRGWFVAVSRVGRPRNKLICIIPFAAVKRALARHKK